GGASGRGGRPSHRCRSANRGCIVAITECACACPPRSRGASRGVRGRERGGPTRSHPEPGRDPPQRRRVLRGAPPGEARPPRAPRGAVWLLVGRGVGRRRGVEQRQLVGLITQRSEVRILPPLPSPCTHAPHSHANPTPPPRFPPFNSSRERTSKEAELRRRLLVARFVEIRSKREGREEPRELGV